MTQVTTLRSRSVRIAGHLADIRLEAPMWEALHDVAHKKRISVVDLVSKIDHERGRDGLAAAIRDYIVAYYRESARSALDSA
jgi:predicted DNA-binding ribbon-helix-helix protein